MPGIIEKEVSRFLRPRQSARPAIFFDDQVFSFEMAGEAQACKPCAYYQNVSFYLFQKQAPNRTY
jgi:hypothetical protein